MISHMKIVLIISAALLFLAIIGMFVRERKRVGARLVENKDSLNAQLEEFAPRKLAGQFLATFGMLIIMAAFYGVIFSESPTPKWSTLFFMLITGVGLLAVGILLQKPRRPRPRYWRTAVNGVVCSGCSLLLLACVILVARTPKENIPRWIWGVIALLLVVGNF